MHQEVIREAGLAGVEELAPAEAPRRHGEVRVLVHDDRALPPELKGDRGQVPEAARMTMRPTVPPVKKM